MSRGVYSSPLGTIHYRWEPERLTGLWFEGQRYFPRELEREEMAGWPALEEWLDSYFQGVPMDVKGISLSPMGTDFQRKVWRRLLEIPYGETVTYGELALELGSGARAVGAAVGRNPISLLIPCHRVVGKGGALTGYAGGVERKAELLALEAGRKNF